MVVFSMCPAKFNSSLSCKRVYSSNTLQGRADGIHNGAVASASGSASATTLSDGSCVVRRKVDDDNSCLFSAVAYVMEGKRSHAKLR